MSKTSDVRQFVAGAYQSPYWKDKVANMPTRQLYAIYGSLLKQEVKKKREEQNKKEFYQFTIWDYINEKGERINNE